MKSNTYITYTKEQFDEMMTTLEAIKLVQRPEKLIGWMSEQELKKLLDVGTTWLWEKRRDRILPFSKIGGKNFYKIEDIQKMLEERYRNQN